MNANNKYAKFYFHKLINKRKGFHLARNGQNYFQVHEYTFDLVY